MKLLLDQNISHLVVAKIEDLFPSSGHVKQFGLHTSNDVVIWNFALERNYTIVTKDSDFHQRSFVFGGPPKVVWIARGNCVTAEIVNIIRQGHEALLRFASHQTLKPLF